MKLLPSNALISLEHLFANEKIKYLRKSEQSDEVISEIKNISIKYRILTPYTQLIGSRESVSQEEKFQIELAKKELESQSFKIHIKSLTKISLDLNVNLYDTIFDVMKQIEDILSIPTYMFYFIYEKEKLLPDFSLKYYSIKPETNLHMALILRGGGDTIINYLCEYPKRNFITSKIDDLISIISEQSIIGNWKKIPDFFSHINFDNIFQNVEKSETTFYVIYI